MSAVGLMAPLRQMRPLDIMARRPASRTVAGPVGLCAGAIILRG